MVAYTYASSFLLQSKNLRSKSKLMQQLSQRCLRSNNVAQVYSSPLLYQRLPLEDFACITDWATSLLLMY